MNYKITSPKKKEKVNFLNFYLTSNIIKELTFDYFSNDESISKWINEFIREFFARY
jgi:hypothetical protein